MRVRADDPEYRREAAAEAEFWGPVQPASIEARELREWAPTATELYHNMRFTGDPRIPWQATLRRYRVGGRLDRVLANCALVGEAKRRLGSRTYPSPCGWPVTTQTKV
jgi:hypothetical protein